MGKARQDKEFGPETAYEYCVSLDARLSSLDMSNDAQTAADGHFDLRLIALLGRISKEIDAFLGGR